MYPLVNKKYNVNDIDLLILQYGLYIILLTYIETDFFNWGLFLNLRLFIFLNFRHLSVSGFSLSLHGRKGCWSAWLTSCAPPLSKRCVGPMPSRWCFKNISPCVKTPLGLNHISEDCLGIILQVFSICLFNVYGQLFSTWNIIFNDFFQTWGLNLTLWGPWPSRTRCADSLALAVWPRFLQFFICFSKGLFFRTRPMPWTALVATVESRRKSSRSR